jgi:hypothetical protein
MILEVNQYIDDAAALDGGSGLLTTPTSRGYCGEKYGYRHPVILFCHN